MQCSKICERPKDVVVERVVGYGLFFVRSDVVRLALLGRIWSCANTLITELPCRICLIRHLKGIRKK